MNTIKQRTNLKKIYDSIAEGMKIRSKYSCYQYGKESTKFFYDLGKWNALCGTIQTLLGGGKEITTPSETSLTLKNVYKNLFQKTILKPISDINMFLSDIHLPTITDENYNICDAEITEDNLLVALKCIAHNKTPGNDGLSKDFYQTFRKDIKDVFINSLKQEKIEGSLNISQRQVVIKLLEKKDRYKRYIKISRPISLISIDTKISSKSFAAKLKPILPSIISSN